jgi:hypothetical protein
MSAVGKLSTFRERVRLKLGEIKSPEMQPNDDVLDVCIDAGVNQYSRLRPRTIVQEIAGDGTTRRYVLDDVLTLWAPGFSILARVASVSDKDTDDEKETEIPDGDIARRRSAAHKDVLFLAQTITTGVDLRLEYTTNHSIHVDTPANTTIPDIDTDFLTAMTASYAAYWIARKASDLANTSLGSSETSYWRLRAHWAERAKELMREASEYVDPKMVSHESAGVAKEWTSESRLAPRRISH